MLLLTAAQMRALDAATIRGGHATGAELMESAGAGVAATLERHYGPALALRVLVLCGPGNNGGDGFVAARHLAVRGAVVSVAVMGERSRLQGDAAIQAAALEAAGLTLTPLASEAELERFIAARDAWDFALDALLGTGTRGAPEGLIAAAVQALRELDERGTHVVALDVPTGVHPDTGEIARRAVRADLTVTFGAPKRGHYLYPGRAFCGTLETVPIGLLGPEAAGVACPIDVSERDALAALVPHREPRAHKGSTGRVLIVGGSAGLLGAVVLAARAATRSGAGTVRAAVPASLADLFAAKLTEEMAIACIQSPARALAREALQSLQPAAALSDAVVLGSGLSREPEAGDLARNMVGTRAVPMVLDADGLNAFAGRAEFAGRATAPLVLTPHLVEMSRLTGLTPQVIEANRIDIAVEWAQRWRVVLVLKGAPTVTAAPDGRATVNASGNPGLATAGTGDVLAGVIGALLAQRLASYDAARLGVYVHGLAGDAAAAIRGELGMAASDVIEELPGVLVALAAQRDAAMRRDAAARR